MFNQMNWRKAIPAFGIGAASVALLVQPGSAGGAGVSPNPIFNANSNKITNPYLPITKFQRCVLAGNDQGQHLRIVRNLQSRTKSFDLNGQVVKAAVVVDRVTDVRAGRLIEDGGLLHSGQGWQCLLLR